MACGCFSFVPCLAAVSTRIKRDVYKRQKLNRFISLALTLGLALSVMATSVSASKFVDAHGNEVELDDTLEAYSLSLIHI